MCPLIEESEKLELQTAVALHAELTAALPDVSRRAAAWPHEARREGRDDGRVRRGRRSHVLVATTVIEVGVDVPNASLMVIEHAERFGLSQLHQLRGRVGRGAAEATCVLLFEEPLGRRREARLKVIFENNDGFEIARQDLSIRGPGEFLGARQSGVPLLRFADLETRRRADRAGARRGGRAAAEGSRGGRRRTRALAGRPGGVHQGVNSAVDSACRSRAFSASSAAMRERSAAVSAATAVSDRRRGMCCGQLAVQPPRLNTMTRSTSAS